MATEIYLIEENAPLISDEKELGRWTELIEKCGLTGQKTLIGEENKSPIPFPLMTPQMLAIYRTLCPTKTKVSDYSHTAIPVRVLSVIALSIQEKYFNDLYIWEDNKKPDPIVVGTKTDPSSSWRELHYIVARWGDELRSIPELLTIAIQRKNIELKSEANAKIAELKHKVESLESLVDDYFYNGNSIYL